MKIEELIQALEDFQLSSSTNELTEVVFQDEGNCPLGNAPINILYPIGALHVHPVDNFLVLTNV